MGIVKWINQQPATGSEVIYGLLNLLIGSAGWLPGQDSDGSVFSSPGAQVTSGSSGTGGLANDRAFKFVRTPDSALWLSAQHRDNASNRNWRFKCSVATPTGGNATQVPTASDDAVYSGGGTDASPTFTDEVIGESDGSGYWAFAVATDTAPYVFCLWTWADNALPNGYVSSLVYLDYIQSWTQVEGDVFPYILHATTTGSGNDTASLGAMSEPNPAVNRTAPLSWLAKGLGGAGFVPVPMVARGNAVTATIAPGLVPLNPVTNKHDLLPIEYIRATDAPSNPKGFKGWSTLFSWRPLTTHVTGDMYSADSAGDNIVLSDLVLNLWANDTASGTGGSPTTRDGRIFTAATQGGSAPVVSNLVPAPGTVLGRDQALQFDVTDADDNILRGLVKVNLGGVVWELPHDGASFSPNYSAGSTRAVITNGFRYTLKRSGGWPGYVDVEPLVFDDTGLLNT